MIANTLTRIQNWFPPIYKEGEGLGYSFRVFRQRIMILIGVATAIFALGFLFWLVLPTEFKSTRDWVDLVVRLILLAVAAQLLFRIGKWYVNEERESARRRAPHPVDDAEDFKLLAETLAAALAVSTLQRAKPEPLSADVAVMDRLTRTILPLMESRRPFKPLIDGGTSTDEDIINSLIMAHEINNLFVMSRLRLKISLATMSISNVVTDDIRLRLEKSVEQRMQIKLVIKTGKPKAFNPILALAELINSETSDKKETTIASDPKTATIVILRWLASINVTAVDDSSRDYRRLGLG